MIGQDLHGLRRILRRFQVEVRFSPKNPTKL